MVLAWGAGDAGQLGDGTTEDRYVPGPVTGVASADVVRIVSGGVGSSSTFVLARPCPAGSTTATADLPGTLPGCPLFFGDPGGQGEVTGALRRHLGRPRGRQGNP